ncbi:MAG TPA: hypothetical protein VF032_20950 [Thermoleophilaceae bacterium]
MLLALGLCALVALSFAGCGGFTSRGATPPGGPRLTLRAGVRPRGGHIWRRAISVKPGSTIEHVIEFANVGSVGARGVHVRAGLRGHDRPVLASEYTKSMGVSVANQGPLAPGLFGKGVEVGRVPGGGSVKVITFATHVGRRSFSEPVELRWNGGVLRRRVHVAVRR